MNSLKIIEDEIKKLIITTLNLEDLTPSDIISEDPLFIDGLGLDSIDALELGIALQKRFKIKIQVSDSDVKQHFYSVTSLAKFISANQ